MSTSKNNPNCLPAIIDDDQPIATNTRDSREDDFIRNMFLGLSVLDAGVRAGYTKAYSSSAIYRKFNSLPFQDKIRNYAIAHNTRSVPKVCNLYARAVDKLCEQVDRGDLDGLAKLKHIPRQILEVGRILSPENAATVNYVNIESLQAIVGGKFVKDKG